MKQAFLILAHNEFEILERLVGVLDDPRFDIYIHFDKKNKEVPVLKTNHSGLYILNNRIDVRWGDYSIVEAEISLFEAALNNSKYKYLHLLSGVDFPIKTMDEIYNFFENAEGKEFIGFNTTNYQNEVTRKVNKFHLFPKDFRGNGNFISLGKRLLRYIYIEFQVIFNINRNEEINFKKGTQWISITSELADFVINKKKELKKIFRNTFCSDEIFMQTICWNSDFKEKIYNIVDEGKGCLREIGWHENEIRAWTYKDFDYLVNTKSFFARKFNSHDMRIINRLTKYILK